jgi:5-methylcytosine-specific restriction endonuclease McrA
MAMSREERNARLRERYRVNPEKVLARVKRWNDSHIEERRAIGRRHYYKDRENILKLSSEWSKANREKRREAAKKYYQKNREQRIAKSIESHRRNREAINLKTREWREKSPKLKQWQEKNREKTRAQRKERWVKYGETFKEFQNLYGTRSPRRVAIYRKWDAAGELCYICGFHVELDEIHIDHVFPVAKGGTNDIGNLMPAHKLCNIRKKDRLDYPIVRPDLIAATAHIQAIPRNLAAQVRSEWESRKLRRAK